MRLFNILFISGLFLTPVIGQTEFVFESFGVGQFGTLKNCVVDMNGDQLDDIVGVRSGRLDFYYQQEDGTFSHKVHRTTPTLSTLWSICAADIDANGYNDIALGYQEYVTFLYADNTGTTYREERKTDNIFSQRTSFADIDSDGDLDAFVCHDENENHPYRNDGLGNLELDYNLIKTPEELPGNYCVTWVDYDNDGDTDMHLAKCVIWAPAGHPGRTNLLYNNDGNSNYTEVGAGTIFADNDQSWVTVWEDFDNDEDFDAITFNHEVSNQYLRNDGSGVFQKVTSPVGIPNDALGATEVLAADFDNDGNIDILTDDPPVIYYGNGDFTFDAVSVSFPAGALGDFNSDGFIDVLNGRIIHSNQGNNNHWIRVNTIGAGANRNALGARLELYGSWGVQIREVRASQSWSPMSTLATHFGIGSAAQIDSLVINWHSGGTTVIMDPPIDTAITVDESNCPDRIIELQNSGDNYLCEGEERTLTAPDGFSTYQWSNGSAGQSIVVSNSGSYNVTVTDANGCSSISSVEDFGSVSDSILIYTPSGTLYCEGGGVLLEVDTDQDVIWSNGSTEKFIYVFEEGIYSLEVTNDCTGSNAYRDSIEVTRYVVEPPMVMDTTIDLADPVNVLSVDDNRIIIWWDNQEGFGSPVFLGSQFFVSDITTDTTFYLQSFSGLPSGVECYSERVPFNIFVSNSSINEILVEGSEFLCADEEVTLTAPSGYSYLWSTGETSQSITVSGSAGYAVTITDSNGNEEILDAVEISQLDVPAPEVEDIVVEAGVTSVEIELGQENLLWWDAPIGGNLLHQGSTRIHDNITADFTYYVEAERELPDGKLCYSERVPLTVFFTSNVSNFTDGMNLRIFPNPTNGIVSLRMDKSLPYSLQVSNIQGQLITSRTGLDSATEIDLQDETPGVYLLQLQFAEHLVTRKIVLTDR